MKVLADKVLECVGPGRALVAIDGVDGSGKTSFAANLAAEITGRDVVTIHVDNFLNPSSTRHAQGRTSPRGFWEDTYDYESLGRYVLDPLGKGGPGNYAPASYDAHLDETVVADSSQAPKDALVLVEGMFLHRDELLSYWDCSVFLDVPFTETATRMALRNGSNPDPEHPSMNRYVGGQRIYFRTAQPWNRASFVVDNTDYLSPRLIEANQVSSVQPQASRPLDSEALLHSANLTSIKMER